MQKLVFMLCIIQIVSCTVIYNNTDSYVNKDINLSNVIFYSTSFKLNVVLQCKLDNDWCPSVKIYNDISGVIEIPYVSSQISYNDEIYTNTQNYHLDDILSGEYSLIVHNCDHLMDGKSIKIMLDVENSVYIVDVLVFILILLVVLVPLVICSHLAMQKMKKEVIADVKEVNIPSSGGGYYPSYRDTTS